MSDGSAHDLFYVKEVISNITPTNPVLDTIRITGCTLGITKDPSLSEEIRSDRQIPDLSLGANNVTGEITFELSYGSFDPLLLASMLGDTWAVGVPSVGTDQAKCGITRHFFTFIRYFSDQITGNPYHIYRGCEISGLEITLAANTKVTGKFTVVGRSLELAADLTGLGIPTYPPVSTTKPFDSFNGTLNEAGAALGIATEMTLTLANGINPRFVVGSPDSLAPSVERSNLTAQLTTYFEDSTLYEKFLNETESDIDFEFLDTSGNSLKLVIPRVKFTGAKADLSGEGPVITPLPVQALRDGTELTNMMLERNPI